MIKYCAYCGAPVEKLIPAGDDRPRFVCAACGRIHYQNPILVVGCIPVWQDQVLLCRRNIEPRKHKWTLPAGYLENGETVIEGARRETWEETGATLDHITPYQLVDILYVNQVYLMFRADMREPIFGPTAESSEVVLLRENQIPWDEIAFTVMEQTLRRFFEDRKSGHFPFRITRIARRKSS